MGSPVGSIFLASRQDTLCSLSLGLNGQDEFQAYLVKNYRGEKTEAGENKFQAIIDQLNEYFSGKRMQFDIPLKPAGTAFQQQVWQALLAIPYGRVTSYGALALKLNKPGAMRAVGAANGKNPIPIIIPCHRVIAADGSLGGYTGGLDIKRKLLDLEQQRFTPALF